MIAQAVATAASQSLRNPAASENREETGGEAGIRTLDTAFRPYNGLANRRLQPLGHLTVSKLLRILRIFLAGHGYGRASVPTSVPKPTRSVPQISIAHDIIAIEDAASLVAAQFHRHTFGDAGTNLVADGRSPEVVRDAAGAAGNDSGAAPRMVKAAGRDRMP